MQSIISKRASLHVELKEQQQLNNELLSKLEKFESLANVGMVSAMIAHEINNILTPVGSYAEMAINNPQDTYIVNKAIQKAASNSQRATKILSSLLNMSKGNSQTRSMNKFSQILDETFSCLARDLKKDGIVVTLNIKEDTDIYCDSIAIQQLLLNLILNAREAMLAGGGSLTIEARTENDETIFSVKDTGSGISEENLTKIFEPFFTTKSRSDQRHSAGSGLGLAYCQRIVDAHDGRISVTSSPNIATEFKIAIPLRADDTTEVSEA